jgi:hypothetical protein
MSKVDDILKKIEMGLKDVTQLHIQTVMGRLEIKNDTEIDFVPNQELDGIISKIDLIDGDIKTQITEKFYEKYPELVQFHLSREAKGHEIIEGNILALGTIVKTLREMF